MANTEYRQSFAFAEIALGQLKALRHPAVPRNYELWYHYATGYNPALNEAVNELLKSNGTITQADVEAILQTYLSGLRDTEQLNVVGARVADEIDQVMAMIDATMGSASRHTENLAGVSTQLGGASDRDSLRSIVASLISTTKEMEQANRALEERLRTSKQEISHLQDNLAAIRSESLTDPLTGLANRKCFDEGLLKAIREARKAGEPLSLIMIDIDHFKRFNDCYGHLTGDQVLRLVAISLQQNIKGQDFAARYGGEEFAVVLPNTGLRQAISVADHIRRVVMTKELVKRSTGENLGRISISAGVAIWQDDENSQSLIERADSCLYAAKRNGRNKVICEGDPESLPLPSRVA